MGFIRFCGWVACISLLDTFLSPFQALFASQVLLPDLISLLQGDKVKLTMQFKGREMDFKNLGREMFQVHELMLNLLKQPQSLFRNPSSEFDNLNLQNPSKKSFKQLLSEQSLCQELVSASKLH